MLLYAKLPVVAGPLVMYVGGHDAACDVIQDAGHVVYWRPTNQIAAWRRLPAGRLCNTFLSILGQRPFVSIGRQEGAQRRCFVWKLLLIKGSMHSVCKSPIVFTAYQLLLVSKIVLTSKLFYYDDVLII